MGVSSIHYVNVLETFVIPQSFLFRFVGLSCFIVVLDFQAAIFGENSFVA